MFSLRFLSRLLTAPIPILVTLFKYFTVGTVYQKTNKEFQNSLYKNIHLSVECHLANQYNRKDVALLLYTPVSTLFNKYKASPLAKGLSGYGEKINDRTYWVTRAEKGTRKNTVILFLHGGGFCLPTFAAQFLGIMGVYYAIPENKRANVSIAMLDYSLTCHNKSYPTQVHEAVASYRTLVDLGYNDIILLGDSCGVNLSFTLTRYIAYPEEAEAHFSKFADFEWDFSPLPQPLNLILISPWVEPYTKPILDPDFDYTGDLGAIDTTMGDWYTEGVDRAELSQFVKFTDQSYEKHWSRVDAVNGTGRTLYIYGEREILRNGIERFADIISKDGQGKLEIYVEDGGVHDGMLYVESLDFMSQSGAQKAASGNFDGKFGYTLVGQFLKEVL